MSFPENWDELSDGERRVAFRLEISTDDLEGMVRRGMVKTLIAGWTVVVPTSEVERMRTATQ